MIRDSLKKARVQRISEAIICSPLFLLLMYSSVDQSVNNGPMHRSESRDKIGKIQKAERFEQVFEKEAEIQLDTDDRCAIKMISDFDIDHKGNFLVADGWGVRDVFVFDPLGSFLRSLGRRGQGPGEYSTPVSIDVTRNGDILVADYMANKIIIYGKDYEFKRSIICQPRLQYYIHSDSHGGLYAYSGAKFGSRNKLTQTVFKYDPNGKVIASFAPFPEAANEINFSAIQDGMAIDAEDHIYEMNPLYYQIRKYTPEGDLVKTFSRKTKLFKVIPSNQGTNPIIVKGPYYLRKGLILAQVNEHIEIFDTEGLFLAGELPFSLNIVGCKDNSIFAELWEEPDSRGNIKNPKIIKYTLRGDI
jgi:hypothetical protein